MINPAAVTLLVGIFTFLEVVFLFPALPVSPQARRRVQIVYFCKRRPQRYMQISITKNKPGNLYRSSIFLWG